MISITFRFENCENVAVPKKYIKNYTIIKDSSGKLVDFEVVFRSGMHYTEKWVLGIPELDKEINENSTRRKRSLFKRLSEGDICWIRIDDEPYMEAPIEPDTDVFYKPNPWQIFDKETKTLTIKNPNI